MSTYNRHQVPLRVFKKRTVIKKRAKLKTADDCYWARARIERGTIARGHRIWNRSRRIPVHKGGLGYETTQLCRPPNDPRFTWIKNHIKFLSPRGSGFFRRSYSRRVPLIYPLSSRCLVAGHWNPTRQWWTLQYLPHRSRFVFVIPVTKPSSDDHKPMTSAQFNPTDSRR